MNHDTWDHDRNASDLCSESNERRSDDARDDSADRDGRPSNPSSPSEDARGQAFKERGYERGSYSAEHGFRGEPDVSVPASFQPHSSAEFEGFVESREASDVSSGWTSSTPYEGPDGRATNGPTSDFTSSAPPAKRIDGEAPSARDDDARVRDAVSERMMARLGDDARGIEVEVHEGVVSLHGEVADRRQKRCAEEYCEGIHGVEAVINRIRVKSSSS